MATHAEPRSRLSEAPRLPARYRPLRAIASGGMAKVWCAEDRLLGRRVAVKILAEPYASDVDAVRRFKREARAAARLSAHPHVVTIFDVGEMAGGRSGSGAPFIVMEHLAGGTVADALRHRSVTPDEAVRWLHEAASALDYAHACGIVHRDIKPANLLLDRQRGLHVADFGIAQMGREETITRAGQVLGTAAYLAPERALGRPATVASDLYSLAVAAFELLTGERPFTAESYIAQARQHLEEEPPRVTERNPALPLALDEVLERGMAKAPEDRYPTAATFATAVERALAPDPAGMDTRAAAILRGRRALAGGAVVSSAPRRRVSLGLLAGAAASVAAMAVGIAWASSGGSPRPASQAKSAAQAQARVSTRHAAVVHHPSAPAHRTPAPPTVTGVPAASRTPTPTAQTLEAQGHALLVAGNYGQAIPVLRQAVAAASPSSLTYAYALFDLGRALRLSGNPRDAVRVLYERLQIPNQTDVVRAELQLALEALGQSSPKPDHGHGHDHGHAGPNGGAQPGPNGGAGPAPAGD